MPESQETQEMNKQSIFIAEEFHQWNSAGISAMAHAVLLTHK